MQNLTGQSSPPAAQSDPTSNLLQALATVNLDHAYFTGTLTEFDPVSCTKRQHKISAGLHQLGDYADRGAELDRLVLRFKFLPKLTYEAPAPGLLFIKDHGIQTHLYDPEQKRSRWNEQAIHNLPLHTHFEFKLFNQAPADPLPSSTENIIYLKSNNGVFIYKTYHPPQGQVTGNFTLIDLGYPKAMPVANTLTSLNQIKVPILYLLAQRQHICTQRPSQHRLIQATERLGRRFASPIGDQHIEDGLGMFIDPKILMPDITTAQFFVATLTQKLNQHQIPFNAYSKQLTNPVTASFAVPEGYRSLLQRTPVFATQIEFKLIDTGRLILAFEALQGPSSRALEPTIELLRNTLHTLKHHRPDLKLFIPPLPRAQAELTKAELRQAQTHLFLDACPVHSLLANKTQSPASQVRMVNFILGDCKTQLTRLDDAGRCALAMAYHNGWNETQLLDLAKYFTPPRNYQAIIDVLIRAVSPERLARYLSERLQHDKLQHFYTESSDNQTLSQFEQLIHARYQTEAPLLTVLNQLPNLNQLVMRFPRVLAFAAQRGYTMILKKLLSSLSTEEAATLLSDTYHYQNDLGVDELRGYTPAHLAASSQACHTLQWMLTLPDIKLEQLAGLFGNESVLDTLAFSIIHQPSKARQALLCETIDKLKRHGAKVTQRLNHQLLPQASWRPTFLYQELKRYCPPKRHPELPNPDVSNTPDIEMQASALLADLKNMPR